MLTRACIRSASFFADKTMITSTSNSQIKGVMSLMKKSGERKSRGLFVIEGLRIFKEVPADRIDRVYASESFAADNGILLDKYDAEIVSDNVFEYMSGTRTPQGILATVHIMDYSADEMISGEKPLLVVLENIQDPGNLGTIVRTAEGAGASGIIMSEDTVDIYNPKVVRSTMGSLFRIPFVYCADICSTVSALNASGIHTYAAHLAGAEDYCNQDFRQPSAILIGNEGNGLTDRLTALAEKKIKIPMAGRLESLNAAVSTAVILYEAARQRRQI